MLFGNETPDDGDGEAQAIENVLNGTAEDSFPLPGCPDRDIGHTTEVQPDPQPVPELDCGNHASSIPSTIFSSNTNRIYQQFCNAAFANHNTLYQWPFDVFGNLLTSQAAKPRMARGLSFFPKRDGGPAQYTNWQVKFDWQPKENYNPQNDACYIDCWQAFEAMALSSCGQKGNNRNMMSQWGQAHIGCGVLGYTIKGIALAS
jgi:hypothetical protein